MFNLTISARLVKEAEVTQTKNGRKISKFNIAVNGNGKNTDFFQITVFDENAEMIAKAPKGARILLAGTMKNNNYEKDGQTIYRNEIYANYLEIFDYKKKETEKTQVQETEEDFPF